MFEELNWDSYAFARTLVNQILFEKSPKKTTGETLISPTYRDNFGKGEISTIGAPIFDSEKNVHGAVGIDSTAVTRGIATAVKLNFGVFDGRFNSYFFVLNRQKEIIYHPRFFIPETGESVTMNISQIEKDVNLLAAIETSLVEGNSSVSIPNFSIFTDKGTGETTFLDSQRINHRKIDAEILVKKMKFSELILGVVIDKCEKKSIFGKVLSEYDSNDFDSCTNFPYAVEVTCLSNF